MDEKGDTLQTIDKEINKGKLIQMVSQQDKIFKNNFCDNKQVVAGPTTSRKTGFD